MPTERPGDGEDLITRDLWQKRRDGIVYQVQDGGMGGLRWRQAEEAEPGIVSWPPLLSALGRLEVERLAGTA